ncbi:Hypothetical predicted protein [Mytilus galloprovincialis]|uniref:Uncharacterized protein n=1 Tax=Mytilus galloprovincialis TaxID=29158 RepID=A0A8B6G829_MYTGA|nr:Hypothetical predicted protein [Mytilus galloprovincialis]
MIRANRQIGVKSAPMSCMYKKHRSLTSALKRQKYACSPKRKSVKRIKTIQLNGKEPKPKVTRSNIGREDDVWETPRNPGKKSKQKSDHITRSKTNHCPAWQVAEQKDLQKLDRLQRKALTLCLDMPSTSGRAALEMEAGVLPIDLRIEEIAIREIAKIQSKSIKEPINNN